MKHKSFIVINKSDDGSAMKTTPQTSTALNQFSLPPPSPSLPRSRARLLFTYIWQLRGDLRISLSPAHQVAKYAEVCTLVYTCMCVCVLFAFPPPGASPKTSGRVLTEAE